jgi:hypothetical protein
LAIRLDAQDPPAARRAGEAEPGLGDIGRPFRVEGDTGREIEAVGDEFHGLTGRRD